MSNSRNDHFPLGGFPSQGQPRSASPSANNSPIDPSMSSVNSRPGFGMTGGYSSGSLMPGTSRSGAGSPSHDIPGSGRLYSKRAREIQAQEGVSGLPYNLWSGPPTSGNSTPLRENIPESPTDGFPEFPQLSASDNMSQPRRARAGTVPSRFSPGGAGFGAPSNFVGGHLTLPGGLAARSVRATPAQTPFGSSSPAIDSDDAGLNSINNPAGNSASSSALLSRLRAGSMPQRPQFTSLSGTNSPFGPSIFSSSWNPSGVGRERGMTLASIASVPSNGPSSPSQSQFSREGGNESDAHMRTLDYLGLAETPQQTRATMATYHMPSMDYAKQPNRMRSYSVNNQNVHEDEYDDYEPGEHAANLNMEYMNVQAKIHNHNLAVAAFASNRKRAQTIGVVQAPGANLMSQYLTGNTPNVPNSLGTPQPTIPVPDNNQFDDLSQSVAGMSIENSNSPNPGLLSVEEPAFTANPTSSLWLGNIPTSTTSTTLTEMFKVHGSIQSSRVLTHKNCGFINFENVKSAMSARAAFNGKEIFPGASPVRINYAKPNSPGNTPGHDGAMPSPSPVSFGQGQDNAQGNVGATGESAVAFNNNGPPSPPSLEEVRTDLIDIVGLFETSPAEMQRINALLQSAISYTNLVDEIPPVPEGKEGRVHDACKLRDIRKRIDGGSWQQPDIDQCALEMVPEAAELSSDYLGNTVIQKVYEHCSNEAKDGLLVPIVPYLAQIGVHKNGTWAAQKIIGQSRTPQQMSSIVNGIRPYTVPLFHDQYGNYVLQCCLPYGVPFNDFLFETMISRLTQLSQGRFGARAMRACLESHHCAKEHQKMLAAMIAIHGAHLSTNPNGALLLTWYLDTCPLPNRRTVLAPRIIPYLVHLCTHKLAYLTVLKIINQKSEPDARDMVLKSLFFSSDDKVLEAILSDSNYGSSFVFKVLTMPFFEEAMRSKAIEIVKDVLVRIKAQPNQGYKRLMDEVGLSTRNNGGPSRDSSSHPDHRRPTSSRQPNVNGHGNANGHTHGGHGHGPNHNHQGQGQQNNRQYYSPMQPATPQSGYEPSFADPAAAAAFAQFNPNMMFGGSNGTMPPPIAIQQMQYQQQMIARPGQQMPFNYPMQPGFPGYPNGGAGAPQVGQFGQAAMVNGSPMAAPGPMPNNMAQMPMGQPGFQPPPPGFNVGMGGYGYNMAPMHQGMTPNAGQQDQGNHYNAHGGGRRGRQK